MFNVTVRGFYYLWNRRITIDTIYYIWNKRCTVLLAYINFTPKNVEDTVSRTGRAVPYIYVNCLSLAWFCPPLVNFYSSVSCLLVTYLCFSKNTFSPLTVDSFAILDRQTALTTGSVNKKM